LGKYSRFLIGLVVVGLLAGVFVVSSAFADEPKPQAGPQAFASSFISKLASALGKTEDEVNGAIKQAKTEVVNELLQQGRISQEQADRTLERIEQGGPFAGLPFGHKPILPRAKQEFMAKQLLAKGQVLKAAAEFLGLPPGQMLKSLREGQSLAEIAQAQGKTREQLKTAIVDSTKQALDKLVASGKLAQQRADAALQRLQENLDKVIDQKHQASLKPARPNRPNN
jgi:uncharacterized protein YidB (DUF937 family)